MIIDVHIKELNQAVGIDEMYHVTKRFAEFCHQESLSAGWIVVALGRAMCGMDHNLAVYMMGLMGGHLLGQETEDAENRTEQ